MSTANDTTPHPANALSSGHAITSRFLLSEATGSLGDLGTFVPITIGMVQIVGFDAGTVLLCTGLACIIAGVVFRIPMPVQPMKAIGALAIAGAMTATQTSVAGLTVGLFILVMAVTGLVGRLDKLIPRPVIRGLQMVVGLLLLRSGAQLALYAPGSAALRPMWAVDGLAIVAVALILTVLLRRRLGWMALGLVVAGFLAAYIKEPGLFQSATVTLWRPALAHMDSSSLSGAWLGGLPQIPMTFLNSVLAISLLAGQLFPAGAGRTTPTRIAVSVGLMNLPIFALGGMPLCHGSGGLAAQHRFGARSSLAVIIRGAALLIIGLLFGRFAMAWMFAFPASLLGVFLLIAGVGLARASQCWHTKPGLLAAIVMVAVHLVTGILVLGFVAGWITCVIVAKLAPRFEQFSDAEAPRA